MVVVTGEWKQPKIPPSGQMMTAIMDTEGGAVAQSR
jgi:hypothetical protein